MVYKSEVKCALYFLILDCILVSPLAAVSVNGELGVKQFYNSVEQNDTLDGVFHGEIGYLTKNFYSADLGFTTGSIKREKNAYNYGSDPELDFTSNLNFSSSVDILFGKMFVWRKYFLVSKFGANFSNVKMHNTIRSLTPQYQIMPKFKIGVAMALNKSNLLTLNYHYTFGTDGP